jgi:hypothetical protein
LPGFQAALFGSSALPPPFQCAKLLTSFEILMRTILNEAFQTQRSLTSLNIRNRQDSAASNRGESSGAEFFFAVHEGRKRVFGLRNPRLAKERVRKANDLETASKTA